jgi:hypothetical protein
MVLVKAFIKDIHGKFVNGMKFFILLPTTVNIRKHQMLLDPVYGRFDNLCCNVDHQR